MNFLVLAQMHVTISQDETKKVIRLRLILSVTKLLTYFAFVWICFTKRCVLEQPLNNFSRERNNRWVIFVRHKRKTHLSNENNIKRSQIEKQPNSCWVICLKIEFFSTKSSIIPVSATVSTHINLLLIVFNYFSSGDKTEYEIG